MVQKYMGKEVALSLFSSLAMNAQVSSPDFLTVIHVLLAFQRISVVAMLQMQQSSVVSVHYTAVNVRSVSVTIRFVSPRY